MKNDKKPKIRFKGFDDDWEQRKVGDCFTERVESMPDGELISVTINDGIKKFSELGRHDNSNDDKSKYKKVCVGDIAYNSMRMWQGASGYSPYEGIVSPAYTVLSPNSGINSKCLAYQFKLPEIIHTFQVNSQGITSDNWNLKYPALSQIEIFVSKDEQEQAKIAKYFENLDNLITLHQRKCDKLQKIKKSMLEKMFPQNESKKPEIRFKGFNVDWEQRKLGDLVISHNAGIYISKEDYGTGTNVIGVGNIYDNDIFDGEIYRLGPVNDEKFLLEENDLIYGESSLVPEGIARTVCVGKNGVGSAFAWHTRRVKLDQSVINSHFATLELNYNIDVRKYLISVSTQTALTGMTTEGYFGVTLSLPTVEEQAHISSLFKQFDHLITLHQRELEKMKYIKKSMLEKMFV